jgi:choline kinase
MKAIILAAGQGTRLRPLTDNLPKCMVPYRGTPIIHHIVSAMRRCGIDDISIVTGYCAHRIDVDGVRYFRNPEFQSTNMVSSLFCAEDAMAGDCIVSYADIVYTPEVLRALMVSAGELSVVIDTRWEELWRLRMENPLEDAETLKLDGEGNLIELGKKAASYGEISGQYIGLFKISGDAMERFRGFYHAMDRTALYDGKDFDNMFMTSLLQNVIERLMPIRAVPVERGWIEIDSMEDLNIYESTGEDRLGMV